MAEDYVEFNGNIMAKEKQLAIPIPHVAPEAANFLYILLCGELDDKLSPGYQIKIRGIVVGLDGDNSKIIIKATIDDEDVMCYVDGDSYEELVQYLYKRMERGSLRWSVDKYGRKK